MTRAYFIVARGRKYPVASLQAAKRLAQRAADETGRRVVIGFDEIRQKPGTRSYRRNPLMGGHDFTDELWKISGIGPNGRKAVAYAETRAAAEREADYLYANYRVRGLTVRRVQAPRKGR